MISGSIILSFFPNVWEFTHNMYCGKDLGQQDDKCGLNGTKLQCVRVHVHCYDVCAMVGLYFNSFYTSVKLYG